MTRRFRQEVKTTAVAMALVACSGTTAFAFSFEEIGLIGCFRLRATLRARSAPRRLDCLRRRN